MDRIVYEMGLENNPVIREMIEQTRHNPEIFAELRQFDQFVSYRYDNGNGPIFEVLANPGNYSGGTYIMRRKEFYNKFTGNIPADVQAFVKSEMRLELHKLQARISKMDISNTADEIAIWSNTIADKMTKKLEQFK